MENPKFAKNRIRIRFQAIIFTILFHVGLFAVLYVQTAEGEASFFDKAKAKVMQLLDSESATEVKTKSNNAA